MTSRIRLCGFLLLAAVPLGVRPLAAGITGSKHDLSSSGGGYFTSDISFSCYFCHSVHTPEEGVGGSGGYPMWNKDLSQLGPYTVYSSATLDSTPASTPQGESLACLSCHDGTVALNVIRSGTLGTMSPTAWLTGRPSELGTDLANDHPVSFTYDDALDGRLHPIENLSTAGLVLYGVARNQLECGSCHDPHDPTHEPFLRIDNAGSALCLACHLK